MMLFIFELSIVTQIKIFIKMKKLNVDALQQRAEAVVSEELLATISGGLENACHDGPKLPPGTPLPPTIDIGPMPSAPGNQTGTVVIKL